MIPRLIILHNASLKTDHEASSPNFKVGCGKAPRLPLTPSPTHPPARPARHAPTSTQPPPTLPLVVKPEPSLLEGKVFCPVCNNDITRKNWARHELTHRENLVCEGICQFTTKDPKTMAKHRESDNCLRYLFALNVKFLLCMFSMIYEKIVE